MGFALSRTIVYWGFDCAEDSIPFTRSTSPPFSLNGLQLRWSRGDSNSHNGFNELHLRFDAPIHHIFAPVWLTITQSRPE